MTSMKLNGKTYVYWAWSVKVFLKGKGLFDHLTSDKLKEEKASSLWEQEDNQIISLMLNTIYLSTSKNIWDHLSHMYFGTGNITRMYEV
jgi:hypothetical protein